MITVSAAVALFGPFRHTKIIFSIYAPGNPFWHARQCLPAPGILVSRKFFFRPIHKIYHLEGIFIIKSPYPCILVALGPP